MRRGKRDFGIRRWRFAVRWRTKGQSLLCQRWEKPAGALWCNQPAAHAGEEREVLVHCQINSGRIPAVPHPLCSPPPDRAGTGRGILTVTGLCGGTLDAQTGLCWTGLCLWGKEGWRSVNKTWRGRKRNRSDEMQHSTSSPVRSGLDVVTAAAGERRPGFRNCPVL